MNIKEIKNVCYLESGVIDCEVLFEEMEEYLFYIVIEIDMVEIG